MQVKNIYEKYLIEHIKNVHNTVLEANGALYTRTAHSRIHERPEEYDGHDG